jgi:uncharacterized protein (TIGR00299 family) protein
MRVVYFDCYAGISGDMIIGAQLELGIDIESLRKQLSSLELGGYEVKSHSVRRGAIAATKFGVVVDQQQQTARNLADIRSLINASSLSQTVKARSISIFERLAVAEAKVHGTTPDKVHFHEVGAVDSIVDTVGAMIGFELLGVDRFYCSSLRVGGGSIETEHGLLPIPSPATAELLRGAPVYAGEIDGEFVTPTGAAIVATLCEQFSSLPSMKVMNIGYGAGTRDPKGFSNALRLIIGEIDEASATYAEACATSERVVVIETNIDDMSPQVCGFVMERAFAAGALDVFVIPAQMKKDRPGVLLTVLCKPSEAEIMIDLLLRETTTLGVRYYEATRRVLERTIEAVETEFGSIRIKVARDSGRTLHFQPEYEDCARIAIESKKPLLEIQAAASAAYQAKLTQEKKTNEHDG